jgi:hypothetical protein
MAHTTNILSKDVILQVIVYHDKLGYVVLLQAAEADRTP